MLLVLLVVNQVKQEPVVLLDIVLQMVVLVETAEVEESMPVVEAA